MLLEHDHHLLPTLRLAGQAQDQLVRVDELDGAFGHLRLEGRHLLDGRLERRLERRDLLGHRLELRLRGSLRGRRLAKLNLRGRELLALGLDLERHVIVLSHRVDPEAHGLARHGHLDDRLRGEGLHGAHRVDVRDDFGRDVVLVKVDERLLELVGAKVVEHLGRGPPIVINLLLRVVGVRDLDRLNLEHDGHRHQGGPHTFGWLLERLDLDNLALVELGEALDGRVECGERLGETSLRRGLDPGALGALLVGRGGAHLGLGLDHLRVLLVLGDLNLLLAHLDLGALEHRLVVRELLLQVGDDRLGRLELVEADGEAPELHVELVSAQHHDELDDVDELEVRGRGHIVVTAHLLKKGLRLDAHRVVHEGAHVHDAVKGLRVVLLGLLHHERAGDCLQRLGRPRREPVDGRAVDEGRELADAIRVVVAERRHGEHDLEELLAHLDEHRAQVGLVRGDARLQAERRHLVEDRPHVGILKQVGHLARREDIVDVLEEDLVGDLRVDEEEDDGAELDARHAQHRL